VTISGNDDCPCRQDLGTDTEGESATHPALVQAVGVADIAANPGNGQRSRTRSN